MEQRHFLICFILLVIIFLSHGTDTCIAYPLNQPTMFSPDDTKYAIVTATSLNIRSESSTKGTVVTKVAKGERLEIISEKGDWSKIKTRDGKTGWCLKKYLSVVEEKKVTTAPQKEKQQQTVKPTPQIKEQPRTIEPRAQNSFQASSPSFGILSGIALSQLAGKYISDEFSTRFGFAAGALAFFPLNHFIGIQPEILYVMKGAVKKSGGIESILHFDYIDLPILLRIKLPVGRTVSPYITIGPLLSYNIQAIVSDNSSNGSVREITDFIKFDYGISAGGGLQFFLLQQNFLIDARYYLGLAQIHDAETNPLELKNKGLTMTLGWMLH